MPAAQGEYKQCTKCRKVKHVDEFYRDGRTKDGFTYYCRPCKTAEVQRHQPTNARLKSEVEQFDTQLTWLKARLPELLRPDDLAKVKRAFVEETGFELPEWPELPEVEDKPFDLNEFMAMVEPPKNSESNP